MHAIKYEKYGTEQVLKPAEIAKPAPQANEILVKIHATSLNASDVEFLTGKPAYTRFGGLSKPRQQVLGSDIAGVVEAVGAMVTQFKIGDQVFGDVFPKFGGLAAYICATEQQLVIKPKSLSFEQAAAIPQAAVVALQGLQKGGIYNEESGQNKKILINGGGGGAGSFAIQLAKSFNANVTAVDNAAKLDFMRHLGADFVIDYKLQDYAKNGQSYDLILDFVASRKAKNVKHAINKNGQYVMVGGDIPSILSILIGGYFTSLFSDKKIGLLIHKQNQADLRYMVERFEVGEALPIIDEVFSLEDTPAAFAKLISGKAKGKIVIQILA